MFRDRIGRIVIAGLVVAALDFSYVTVLWVVVRRVLTLEQLAQTIATGLLGKAAFQGGIATAIAGGLLHLTVAFTWTMIFYALVRLVPDLGRRLATRAGRVTVGLLWGPVIWLVMDLVVLPLSRARPTPVSSPHFYINLVQHALMVGLPMVLILGDPARYRRQV